MDHQLAKRTIRAARAFQEGGGGGGGGDGMVLTKKGQTMITGFD